MQEVISERQRRFLDGSRVGHLATADRSGAPHLIPVCYATDGESLYITIDEKPKRQDRPLKRVLNIIDNPQTAFVVDRWDEDWRRLGWVMLRGASGNPRSRPRSADQAQGLLIARYPQYRTMNLAGLPVIAMRITRVSDWGDLSDNPG